MIGYPAGADVRGIKEARRALRQRQTPSEELLWQSLRRKQLGIRAHRQYSIGRYILDFYLPAIKVGIEIDGEIHNELHRRLYDEEREEVLRALGIRLLRFKRQYVIDHTGLVLKSILSVIHTIQKSERSSSDTLFPKGEG